MRRTQAERSAIAVANLVEAATALLSEQGFARTSTKAIAARAGVTTGALHHHFATKESLFIAVLDDAAKRIIVTFSELGSKPVQDTSMSRQLLDSLWAVYGNERYWAVWEINIGLRGDPQLQSEVQIHRTQTRKRILEALDANIHLDAHTRRCLAGALPFLLSSLRGIFLETFVRASGEHVDAQLDMLAAILEDLMGNSIASHPLDRGTETESTSSNVSTLVDAEHTHR